MKKIYCMFLLFSICFSNYMLAMEQKREIEEIDEKTYYIFSVISRIGNTCNIAVPNTYEEEQVALIEKICTGTQNNNLYVITKDDFESAKKIRDRVKKEKDILISVTKKRKKHNSVKVPNSIQPSPEAKGKALKGLSEINTQFTELKPEERRNVARQHTEIIKNCTIYGNFLTQTVNMPYFPLINVSTKKYGDEEINAVYLMRIIPEYNPTIIDKMSDCFLLGLPLIISFVLPNLLMNAGGTIVSHYIIGNEWVHFFAKHSLVTVGTAMGMYMNYFLICWKILPNIIKCNFYVMASSDNFHWHIDENASDALNRAKVACLMDMVPIFIAKVLVALSWHKLSYVTNGVRGLCHCILYQFLVCNFYQEWLFDISNMLDQQKKFFRPGRYITGSIALCCAFATYYYLK